MCSPGRRDGGANLGGAREPRDGELRDPHCHIGGRVHLLAERVVFTLPTTGALISLGLRLFACKDTLVTFCGMVSLRVVVLGRLGRTPSPHPRACALSCPSPAFSGGPASFGRRRA